MAGAMTKSGNPANGTSSGGFTIVELVVSIAVILIITGVALPSFLQSYRTYQLSDAASEAANLLKLTRFEAIRRNTPVSCQIRQAGSATNFWVDSNGNANMDVGETQVVFTGTVGPISAGAAPGTGVLAAAGGVPPPPSGSATGARGALAQPRAV